VAFGVALALSACGSKPPGPKPPEQWQPPPVTRGDWYTYRHDSQRTACSGKIGPQEPQILWSVPGYGPTVFSKDNTAFGLFGEDGANMGAARDGQVLWLLDGEVDGHGEAMAVTKDDRLIAVVDPPEFDIGEAVRCYTADGEVAWESPVEFVFGTLTIDGDDALYFQGYPTEGDFAFFALDKDGQVGWQLPLGYSEFLYTQAVTPDGDIVATLPFGMTFPHNGPTVMKLDGSTGEILWEQVVSAYYAPPLTVVHWDPSLPMVAGDGTIYVLDVYGVHAYAPDGSERWTYSLFDLECPWEEGPIPLDGWPPALGPGGTIYVTLMEEVETYATALIALSPQGELLWRRDEHVEGAPIVDAAGTVYLGSGYGEPGMVFASVSQAEPMQPRNSIIAINPDGTTKWEFSAPDELEVGTVWCMDNEGNLVVSGRIPGGDDHAERLFWIGDG
jgi:outer membrane protein assembly factor BamB